MGFLFYTLHLKTKRHPEQGVFYAHKLSTNVVICRSHELISQFKGLCVELLVIIYQDRRVPQALGGSFLYSLKCCPQVHLLAFPQGRYLWKHERLHY